MHIRQEERITIQRDEGVAQGRTTESLRDAGEGSSVVMEEGSSSCYGDKEKRTTDGGGDLATLKKKGNGYRKEREFMSLICTLCRGWAGVDGRKGGGVSF